MKRLKRLRLLREKLLERRPKYIYDEILEMYMGTIENIKRRLKEIIVPLAIGAAVIGTLIGVKSELRKTSFYDSQKYAFDYYVEKIPEKDSRRIEKLIEDGKISKKEIMMDASIFNTVLRDLNDLERKVEWIEVLIKRGAMPELMEAEAWVRNWIKLLRELRGNVMRINEMVFNKANVMAQISKLEEDLNKLEKELLAMK